jgi:hypothetical protein
MYSIYSMYVYTVYIYAYLLTYMRVSVCVRERERVSAFVLFVLYCVYFVQQQFTMKSPNQN